MTSIRRPASYPCFVFALAALALLAGTRASALRVVDYNILNYPGNSGPARAPYYRTILLPLNADVIVTEEMSNAASNTEFLNEVLNVMEPGQWATVPFIDGNDTDASLFYRTAKVQFLGQWAFYPNPANLLRFVHVYRLKPVGYTSLASELRIYTAHLKASTGYESQRLAECTGMRDSMNAMPAGTHALICGDMNFYTQAAEPGYAKLLESEANNTGRVYDLLPAGSWHDGASFAAYHTQSPCLSGGCASGAATGGMDDRFDMILPTLNLAPGQGLTVIPGTCVPVGNDGLHLNKAITDAPTIPEGAAYASALILASDHLPLRVDLQVPAKISTSPSLAFGSVIVGASSPSLNLTVSNPATPPADSLNCTFAAPAGFGAPVKLAVVAGGSAPAAITMAAATSGLKSGNLTIASDAPENPTTLVGLSGTVLEHAQASLDSLNSVVQDTLDFGVHAVGGFSPMTAAVHDRLWNSLRARLSVGSATITGGGGRFSIAGFSPVLVAGTAGRWNVSFNEAGAIADSTYTATLQFTTADEPLPGATAQLSLSYVLRARVTGGTGDHTPPVVVVASPNGGEIWNAGSVHDITWSATDSVGVTAIEIDLSTNNDANWASLATGEANDGTYGWTVPNSPTSQALIRVKAHDAAGNIGSDTSDGVFTIRIFTITASTGAGGSIAPSGAIQVVPGANQAFAVNPDACYAIADVLVDGSSVGAVAGYTFTDVQTDHTISASFALDTFNLATSVVGSGTLTIAPLKANYDCGDSVKITALPNPGWGFDHWTGDAGGAVNPLNLVMNSSRAITGVFVDIASPTITLNSPNGGEVWVSRTLQPITWTAADNVGVTQITLAYSTDGGLTYPNVIVTAIPNTGSYSWSVPNTEAALARVRAVAHDAAGNVGADPSDANFEIQNPLSAAEGALLATGETAAIYPNPALAGTVHLLYRMPRAGAVEVSIFDVAGHLVRRLDAGSVPAGVHDLRWDGQDANGRPVGAGIYLIRVATGSGRPAMKRFTIIR